MEASSQSVPPERDILLEVEFQASMSYCRLVTMLVNPPNGTLFSMDCKLKFTLTETFMNPRYSSSTLRSEEEYSLTLIEDQSNFFPFLF